MSNFDIPTLAKWQSAFFSTFLISTFPNMFLYLVPVSWLTQKKGSPVNVQHILLSFACGGLLGDVLLHAVPHLMSAHGHDERGGPATTADAVGDFMAQVEEEGRTGMDNDESRSLVVGSLVLAGFLFFFTAERVLTTFLTPHSHSHGGHKDTHCRGNEQSDKLDQSQNQEQVEEEGNEEAETHKAIVLPDYSRLNARQLKEKCVNFCLPTTGKKSVLLSRLDAYSLRPTPAPPPSHVPISYLSASGWLNLAADFLHNFTDGLAMGAAHASTSGGGGLALAATLSIFCHEVPHEIGDFTILIQNGMSKNTAIRLQFLTSAGAFLGTAVGLLASSLRGWDRSLVALTSGGFLYVATVSLIPTILKKDAFRAKKWCLLQIVLEAGGFALGVGMMAAVSLMEGGCHH